MIKCTILKVSTCVPWRGAGGPIGHCIYFGKKNPMRQLIWKNETIARQ